MQSNHFSRRRKMSENSSDIGFPVDEVFRTDPHDVDSKIFCIGHLAFEHFHMKIGKQDVPCSVVVAQGTVTQTSLIDRAGRLLLRIGAVSHENDFGMMFDLPIAHRCDFRAIFVVIPYVVPHI